MKGDARKGSGCYPDRGKLNRRGNFPRNKAYSQDYPLIWIGPGKSFGLLLGGPRIEANGIQSFI
jgi:hypothetical protein